MTERSLAFPESTELIGLVFSLSSQTDGSLFPDYAKGLHAWFLHQVREDDRELSRYMHDGQSEKPFTISRLEGKMATNGKQLYLSARNTYLWYVTALSQPVVLWMQQWLKRLPKAIALHDLKLDIKEVKIAYAATTYDNLLKTKRSKNLTLSFISPTSFRSKGHHFPLPVPNNLFHSYLRRWNHFAPYKFDPDSFLPWIEENVVIVRHQLESIKVAGGKRGSVTGFLGAIELSLAGNSSQNSEYVQLYKALGQLAPYCGTGHKTTFGLGQTKLGWLLSKDSTETMVVDTLLARRIEEIYGILMQAQKRTGGERASNVCKNRATILARREFGESLIEIAKNLEMPYDTVKSYVKLARRVLNADGAK